MANKLVRRLHRTFATLAAAARAANAVEVHHRPHTRDLETLGIDPTAFNRLL